jgi:hypothetical protein
VQLPLSYQTTLILGLADPFERGGDPDSYFRVHDLLEIRQIFQKLKAAKG